MNTRYKLIALFCGASMLFGISLAVYIYVFNFKTISETEMIAWAPYWLFPIILGYYGTVANRTVANREKAGFETVSNVVFELIKGSLGNWAAPILLLIHLPFLVIRTKSILLTTLVGSLIWAIALYVFLQFVFPYL